ncbi:hypothetical protein CR969_02200 [Candidatus Saccharibacteria bacterium]|nr:MAG: hypothetical protein CR969_02200 [Candidatus Saccharibacteria bacterium]
MAVMTMRSPTSWLEKIKSAFPELEFAAGDNFAWLPKQKTVVHPANLDSNDDKAQLLHEISHGLLDHQDYSRDIGLIDMERQAWEYAVDNLAPKFEVNLSMDDDIVQDSLDTYRQWLYKRSLCPDCQAVGLEQKPQNYRCLNCSANWRVNDARTCQLKRYKKPR